MIDSAFYLEIFDYVVVLAFLIAYIIGGIYIIGLIRKRIILLNTYLKIFIVSFLYAMIFGLGLYTTGGDPGFGFPCPVFFAGLFFIWDWPDMSQFVFNFLIPLVFWWTLSFIILFIKEILNKRKIRVNEVKER